ncbi:MAG: hypothetical protein IH804_00555 [Planctomycetes bacterium]|nr:hypothetical protein [Planctomycetota bacterium]
MTDIASVNSIESPNRSDAEVEGAMVLLGSGLSSVKVSELTGIPASTLRDWARSSALVAKYGEAIRQARVRIAMRTSQLVEQILDDIEDGIVNWAITSPTLRDDVASLAEQFRNTQGLERERVHAFEFDQSKIVHMQSGNDPQH